MTVTFFPNKSAQSQRCIDLTLPQFAEQIRQQTGSDKLADESFVLSQAYLYGSVNANPAHRVEVIDGDFIDLRTDLDPGAVGKSPAGKDAKPTVSGQREEDRVAPSRTDAEITALLVRS